MTPPDDDDEARRSKSNLLIAAAVVAIVALGMWLAYAVYQNLQLQKCILEGRRDCAPIEIPQGN
jgi:uncharacterized membrane protein YebE (DUF533 family)